MTVADKVSPWNVDSTRDVAGSDFGRNLSLKLLLASHIEERVVFSLEKFFR